MENRFERENFPCSLVFGMLPIEIEMIWRLWSKLKEFTLAMNDRWRTQEMDSLKWRSLGWAETLLRLPTFWFHFAIFKSLFTIFYDANGMLQFLESPEGHQNNFVSPNAFHSRTECFTITLGSVSNLMLSAWFEAWSRLARFNF